MTQENMIEIGSALFSFILSSITTIFAGVKFFDIFNTLDSGRFGGELILLAVIFSILFFALYQLALYIVYVLIFDVDNDWDEEDVD